MEPKLLAQTLHRMAQQELSPDNVGRLILREVRRETWSPNLTFTDIQQLWSTFYPDEDVDESCGVIRVYFYGKTTTYTIRQARPPIIPEPETYPLNNGEIFSAEPPEKYDQDFPANKPDNQNVIWR